MIKLGSLVYRFVRFTYSNPGVDGRVCVRVFGVTLLVLTSDAVRRMYYGVLGIRHPSGTLREYVESDVNPLSISVDVPEDVLRVERAMQR